MATFRVQAHSSVPACKAPLRQSRLVPHVLGSQGTNDFSQAKRREFLSQVSGMILGGAVLINAEPANALGFKKDMTKKRRLVIPDDEYLDGPEGLKYVDLKLGTGTEAKVGARVAIHYDCKWRGLTFMTSRQGMGVTGGNPFGFDLGTKSGESGGTLKGLDLGVRGMRIGGLRRLKVPPELAYGNRQVGEIPPNSTLDIDVELLSIKGNPFGKRVKGQSA